MEDEALLNFILERLYEKRFQETPLYIRRILQEAEIHSRKNQLRRVMADLVNNGFVIMSPLDEDDYEAALTPEGVLYCEEVLMLR